MRPVSRAIAEFLVDEMTKVLTLLAFYTFFFISIIIDLLVCCLCCTSYVFSSRLKAANNDSRIYCGSRLHAAGPSENKALSANVVRVRYKLSRTPMPCTVAYDVKTYHSRLYYVAVDKYADTVL